MTKIYEALEHAQKELNRASVRSPESSAAALPLPDLETELTALYFTVTTLLRQQGGKSVQFISVAGGEGTSTIIREFAKIAACKIGNAVLLVDNNRHSPNQYDCFNMKIEHDWLESIQGDLPAEKTIRQVGGTNLYLCMLSRDGDACAPVLQSPEFASAWTSLGVQFDLILVDSPALAETPDGILMSPLVTGVVLVVEADKTRWPVVNSSKEKITTGGGNIFGVVLNKRRYYIPESIYHRL